MGTRKVTITVCDNCQRQKPVARWRITHNGVTRTLDLCVECAAPLTRLHASIDAHDLFTPATEDDIAEARRRRLELEG